MGLDQITSIQQTRRPTASGGFEDVLVVRFTTEETTGFHEIEIPADEFDRSEAERRAEDRSAEIDAAVTGG